MKNDRNLTIEEAQAVLKAFYKKRGFIFSGAQFVDGYEVDGVAEDDATVVFAIIGKGANESILDTFKHYALWYCEIFPRTANKRKLFEIVDVGKTQLGNYKVGVKGFTEEAIYDATYRGTEKG